MKNSSQSQGNLQAVRMKTMGTSRTQTLTNSTLLSQYAWNKAEKKVTKRQKSTAVGGVLWPKTTKFMCNEEAPTNNIQRISPIQTRQMGTPKIEHNTPQTCVIPKTSSPRKIIKELRNCSWIKATSKPSRRSLQWKKRRQLAYVKSVENNRTKVE